MSKRLLTLPEKFRVGYLIVFFCNLLWLDPESDWIHELWFFQFSMSSPCKSQKNQIKMICEGDYVQISKTCMMIPLNLGTWNLNCVYYWMSCYNSLCFVI